jgi:putative transposase
MPAGPEPTTATFFPDFRDGGSGSIQPLVVIGVRADGQKVLLAIKSMGGESAEAWRTVLDDLIARGLRQPEFLIVRRGTGATISRMQST